MSETRALLRAIVPPVLGLGLALLVVRPLSPEPPAAIPLPLTGSRPVVASVATAGNVVTTVPPVAFTERISVARGRIHTPVLVNVSEPVGGTASVVGLARCEVAARPGVVAWLDCAYSGARTTLTVSVVLRDGRRFSHTARPSFL